MDIPIISELFNSVFKFFTLDKEAKLKIKALKAEAEIKSVQRKFDLQETIERAAIDREANTAKTESNYDLIALEASRNSLVDEIMIFWVLSITTMMFIPNMQPYVIAGFEALEDAPLFWQLVFVGGFISKLGLRFLFSGRSLFGRVV